MWQWRLNLTREHQIKIAGLNQLQVTKRLLRYYRVLGIDIRVYPYRYLNILKLGALFAPHPSSGAESGLAYGGAKEDLLSLQWIRIPSGVNVNLE